ncbi:hypothetical protein K5I29_10660 [Flavobacterium agricola]|uniref:Polysaccharide chain length determinant N-terminal domain-containing protein n=1 Tax=Flavobacterium agricola TaxID=2870839 RepID=A0ABY6LX92_9FLAO|nr:hypothetical protein [Flavobacterium agricola]UYW00952.1 hypothetical protein K5I29_10660 [Flavobacterium agricola]
MEQQNANDQEIDLGQLFDKIKSGFEYLGDRLFDLILFIKKNFIILIALLAIGFGVGSFITKSTRVYEQKIIVSPNFGSTEYVYEQIALINSKVKANDSIFFKVIGIENFADIQNITITPIVEVYQFIDQKPTNFEMLKLLAQGAKGDKIDEVLNNETTSKNYTNHLIHFTSKKIISRKEVVEPLLNYLNSSRYYIELMNLTQLNIDKQITANDSILTQVDRIIKQFASHSSNINKDNLVYYNDNNQVNEIIKQKSAIVNKLAELQIQKFNSDVIVKEVSTVPNALVINTNFQNLKFILPIAFVSIFIIIKLFLIFYRNQMLKRNQL